MKKIVSLIFALILIMQTSLIFANATDAQTESDKGLTELKAVNLTIEETNDGTWYNMDLVKENTDELSSRIFWTYEGVMGFKLRLMPENNLAEVTWRVQLTSDFVKAVKGTIVLEKDILGPINPNYDKEKVNHYNSVASSSFDIGSVALSFPEDDYNQNIIMKWSSFTVTGITGNYSVYNGNIQGEVHEFI